MIYVPDAEFQNHFQPWTGLGHGSEPWPDGAVRIDW